MTRWKDSHVMEIPHPLTWFMLVTGFIVLMGGWLFGGQRPSLGYVCFLIAPGLGTYFAEELGDLRERLERLREDVRESRRT